MDTTYTTRQGDQWDAIAKKVYGDEKYAGYLMAVPMWTCQPRQRRPEKAATVTARAT